MWLEGCYNISSQYVHPVYTRKDFQMYSSKRKLEVWVYCIDFGEANKPKKHISDKFPTYFRQISDILPTNFRHKSTAKQQHNK